MMPRPGSVEADIIINIIGGIPDEFPQAGTFAGALIVLARKIDELQDESRRVRQPTLALSLKKLVARKDQRIAELGRQITDLTCKLTALDAVRVAARIKSLEAQIRISQSEEREVCAKVAADWLTHWVNDCLTELPEDAAKSAWTLPDSIRHRDTYPQI